MRKLLFLVNPNAGQRRVNKSLGEIIGIFNEGGYEVTVTLFLKENLFSFPWRSRLMFSQCLKTISRVISMAKSM